MTVAELIQALQELNRPDLEVYVPCPHCCGQPGADFDRLDADYCLTMVREGRSVAVLGDPRHECLQDRRNDSRRDVGRALLNNPAGIALALGLQFVRTLGKNDLAELAAARTDLRFDRTIFGRLVRADLVLEARAGEETRYVVVVSPYRASSEEQEELEGYGSLMTELPGLPVHQMVASVASDPRAREIPERGSVHWYQVLQEDADRVREEVRRQREEEMRLWREKRAQEVNPGDRESDQESDRESDRESDWAAGSDPGVGG